MDPQKLKGHLTWLSMPYAEVLSDYERINQFCKYVPDLIDYVNSLEPWVDAHAQVVSDLIAARIQIEELKEKAAMYDGLCD
jgi:hypothetical protein